MALIFGNTIRNRTNGRKKENCLRKFMLRYFLLSATEDIWERLPVIRDLGNFGSIIRRRIAGRRNGILKGISVITLTDSLTKGKDMWESGKKTSGGNMIRERINGRKREPTREDIMDFRMQRRPIFW